MGVHLSLLNLIPIEDRNSAVVRYDKNYHLPSTELECVFVAYINVMYKLHDECMFLIVLQRQKLSLISTCNRAAIAEWLACPPNKQKVPGSNPARATQGLIILSLYYQCCLTGHQRPSGV